MMIKFANYDMLASTVRYLVHVRYPYSIGADTSLSTTGTCTVPVPVLVELRPAPALISPAHTTEPTVLYPYGISHSTITTSVFHLLTL